MPSSLPPFETRSAPTRRLPPTAEGSEAPYEEPYSGEEAGLTAAGHQPAGPHHEPSCMYYYPTSSGHHLSAVARNRSFEPDIGMGIADSRRSSYASSEAVRLYPVSSQFIAQGHVTDHDSNFGHSSVKCCAHEHPSGVHGHLARNIDHIEASKYAGAGSSLGHPFYRGSSCYRLRYHPSNEAGPLEDEAYHRLSSAYPTHNALPTFAHRNDTQSDFSSQQHRKTYKCLSSEPTIPAIETEPPIRLVESRKKVKRACIYCKRSHMPCSSARPCARCIKRGIAHLCSDEPPGNIPSDSAASTGRASAEAAMTKGSLSVEAAVSPSGCIGPLCAHSSTTPSVVGMHQSPESVVSHEHMAEGAELDGRHLTERLNARPAMTRMPGVAQHALLTRGARKDTQLGGAWKPYTRIPTSRSLADDSGVQTLWWETVDFRVQGLEDEQGSAVPKYELFRLEALLQCPSRDLAPTFTVAPRCAGGSFDMSNLEDDELASAVWHAWSKRERPEREEGLAAWLQETLSPQTIWKVGTTLGRLRLRCLRTILSLDQQYREGLTASAQTAIIHHRLSIFESVPQAMFVCSSTSRILAANSSLTRWLRVPAHLFASSRIFYFQLLPHFQIAMVLQAFVSLATATHKRAEGKGKSTTYLHRNATPQNVHKSFQSINHDWIVDRLRLLQHKPAWDHGRSTYLPGAPQKLDDGTPSVVRLTGHVLLHAHYDRRSGAPLFVVGYATQKPRLSLVVPTLPLSP